MMNVLRNIPGRIFGRRLFESRISRMAAIEGLFLAMSFFAARVLIFDVANPFSVAYLSAFLYRGNKFFAGAVFAILGIFSRFRGADSFVYLLAIILMCILNLLLKMRNREGDWLAKAASGAACALAAGLGLTILRGAGLFAAAINLLEAGLVFASAIVLMKGINCLDGRVKRGRLNHEEIISVVLLMGLIAAGAADISIWLVSLRYLSVSLIVLLAAGAGGATFGATIGVFLGFLLHITGFEYIYFAVLLGLAGFGAGALRENRIASIFAFLGVGLFCALFFNVELLSIQTLLSVLLAGMVFFVIPRKFLPGIHFVINPATIGVFPADSMSKLQEMVVGRVENFANGYQKLAKSLEAFSKPRDALGRREVNQLISDIRASCCAGCPKEGDCWGSKEMEEHIVNLATICGKTGEISLGDMPVDLAAKCIHAVRLLAGINHEYEISCINFEWRNRLSNARASTGRQLAGAARVMEKFAGELRRRLVSYAAEENRIMQALSLEKIDVRSVVVSRNGAGRAEVDITMRRGTNGLTSEVMRIISAILACPMELRAEIPLFGGSAPLVRLEFAAASRYAIAWGAARANKTGGAESGDSFSFMQLACGNGMMAISDGMGSGRRAQEESKAAIELLEDFSEQGFDKSTTLDLINSALLLKSSEELFSTLDICTIDLNSGMAEFIKIGAAPTLAQIGGEIRTITSRTLPVGILEDVDAHIETAVLSHGDVVVMMTDGVTDSDNGGSPKEGWIIRALQAMAAAPPQDTADYILAKGMANYGNNIRDDMTVFVGRIYEQKKY